MITAILARENTNKFFETKISIEQIERQIEERSKIGCFEVRISGKLSSTQRSYFESSGFNVCNRITSIYADHCYETIIDWKEY